MQKQAKNPVIGIVGGRGILGTVFRREFEKLGITVLISGRKPAGEVLSHQELVKKSDIVIVSVPLEATAETITAIAPLLRPDQLFADFTSIKTESTQLMLKSKSEVIGLHPMFGEIASVAGLSIFACPVRPKKLWAWLKQTLLKLDLTIHEISPAEHDELAAVHQAAPHLLSVAYGAFLARRKIKPNKIFPLASPSTRLSLLTTGRLLACDPALYRDIQIKNPAAQKAAQEIAAVIREISLDATGKTFFREFQASAQNFGNWKKEAFAETNRLFDTLSRAKVALTTHKVSKTPRNPVIAVMGPSTNTELAAREFLQKTKLQGEQLFCRTIGDVFQSVQKDKAPLGIVPLENYSVGPVRETMKALYGSTGKIQILTELSQAIGHALLARNDVKPKDISRIYAHPQAAAQCRRFLQKKFPRAEVIEMPNTGEALKAAQADEAAAAIGPAELAANGLRPLQKNIADDPNNRTRFIVIKMRNSKFIRQNGQNSKLLKTALAFSFSSDSPGQLATALTIFAKNSINLSRIESIPLEKKGYFFFTECDADNQEPRLKNSLKELGKLAKVVNLGSYGEI